MEGKASCPWVYVSCFPAFPVGTQGAQRRCMDDGRLPDESMTLYQVTVVERFYFLLKLLSCLGKWRAVCLLGSGVVNK